jgi:RHS repeat-associated protein
MVRHVYSPELRPLTRFRYENYLGLPRLQHATDSIWFADRPIAHLNVTTGTLAYTAADHLGTPFLQTDATAAVIWRAEYDPYGTVVHMRTGSESTQPLRFPGQEVVVGVAERYNVFRWYRAGWGRYTQADPLMEAAPQFWATMSETTAGTSTYAYGLNSPLRVTDPLGLAPVKNNSPAGVFWYKPDSCATTPCPIKECKPGETCNVDGIYPPNCKSNPFKIVDGCTGTIDAKGKLAVICSAVGKAAGILKGVGSDGYGQVDDVFMKNHPDWPKPNSGPGCVKKNVCN